MIAAGHAASLAGPAADSLLDEAGRRKQTLRETPGFLREREIAQRDDQRIAMVAKIAHFPAVRELE
jgi:hypothetical protein